MASFLKTFQKPNVMDEMTEGRAEVGVRSGEKARTEGD
jgi:hypothetical protein